MTDIQNVPSGEKSEPKLVRCFACKKPVNDPEEFPTPCQECAQRYPPSLLKACCDQFDYACKLTSGEIIYFTKATISGEYCALEGLEASKQLSTRREQKLPHPFPRGLDVRVSDILWCADAPEGS
jgi:hypothetical protein